MGLSVNGALSRDGNRKDFFHVRYDDVRHAEK